MILLWYMPTWLMMPLLWVLVRRGVYKQFRWFFAYAVFAVTSDVVRLVVGDYAQVYRATYWITDAGRCVLGILVMHEVFRALLGRLIKVWWARLIFPLVLAASIGLSIARTQTTAAQLGGRLMLYIVVGEIAVRFVQVLIFVGLVAMVPLLGLRWRQYAFGIATGFGLYSTVALLATTKFSDFGTQFKFLWFVISVASYSIAVLIWLWFFSVAEKSEVIKPKEFVPSPDELEQYRQALRRIP
jgi:hypothetical protein